jgi:hypothetical protein
MRCHVYPSEGAPGRLSVRIATSAQARVALSTIFSATRQRAPFARGNAACITTLGTSRPAATAARRMG